MCIRDSLIAEMLRQKKVSTVLDESKFDEIEVTDGDEDDAPEPTKH